MTVLSRCQRFDLRRVEQPVLAEHFRKIVANEGAKADADALALIARAAEGSVRDGLSILDQAIAMGEGHVTAKAVRAMLGLADRGRIFDLAEMLFRGDAAGALGALKAMHHDGAEPAQIVSDLAEAVHTIARIKAVGEEPGSEGLSIEEKRRGTSLAERLSMPYLSRAWQMLLKGLEETSRAPVPYAAAEMVLIRLAYTADLPTPDDLIRTLGGGAVSAGRAAGRPRQSAAPRRSRAVERSRRAASHGRAAAEPDHRQPDTGNSAGGNGGEFDDSFEGASLDDGDMFAGDLERRHWRRDGRRAPSRAAHPARSRTVSPRS